MPQTFIPLVLLFMCFISMIKTASLILLEWTYVFLYISEHLKPCNLLHDSRANLISKTCLIIQRNSLLKVFFSDGLLRNLKLFLFCNFISSVFSSSRCILLPQGQITLNKIYVEEVMIWAYLYKIQIKLFYYLSLFLNLISSMKFLKSFFAIIV